MRALMIATLAAPFALALTGCGQPHHLGPDHGESYRAAFTTQADLTRASAVDDQYPLSGFEAMEIRMRVQEATTDQETATPESTANIGVE
jgi:predicted lysophospholipase L1 biosynthesis ABC-type transport system permease subunit